MRKTKIKTLLDVQVDSKVKIDDVDNEDDLIKICLSVATIHLTRLVPTLIKFSVDRKSKVKTDFVVKELGVVLEHIFTMCNACNVDIPEDKELASYERSVPDDVKYDSVLTIMAMINATTDLFNLFYVNTTLPPWENDAIEDEFVEILCTIIVGMKHLGEKFNFTADDVIATFS